MAMTLHVDIVSAEDEREERKAPLCARERPAKEGRAGTGRQGGLKETGLWR